MKDIHDVITHAKFGDDRLRGSGVVADQISAFPIDFAGRPYNTLTLSLQQQYLYCTPYYWKTEGTSQNDHQSVSDYRHSDPY